jgi:hypothetical protein
MVCDVAALKYVLVVGILPILLVYGIILISKFCCGPNTHRHHLTDRNDDRDPEVYSVISILVTIFQLNDVVIAILAMLPFFGEFSPYVLQMPDSLCSAPRFELGNIEVLFLSGPIEPCSSTRGIHHR